ncbi:hypothetical protein Y032_0010g916 [Ancylostoma ceylanicum]|uniref:Uncharacterized protein n=1 Tax=Ancylostoma ceylanicum TaxID=53326 RepID=A0A016VGZ9_9BILA|nr:hypothetical protein Y032_0010g916 [Ancylostoma ceylanicum]
MDQTSRFRTRRRKRAECCRFSVIQLLQADNKAFGKEVANRGILEYGVYQRFRLRPNTLLRLPRVNVA